MSVSEKIATRVKVELDTSQLDNLTNSDGIINLSDIVSDLKSQLETGADNVAEAGAEQLEDYGRLFFWEYEHPFSVGYSGQLWTIESDGEMSYMVDNMALGSTGYPYLDAIEYGNEKIKAMPFMIHAREALEMDVDRLVNNNIGL